jgi:putative tricarboxylic transport membrane protein
MQLFPLGLRRSIIKTIGLGWGTLDREKKGCSMKKYELMSSLVWMSVGLFFCVGSIALGLGRLHEPGPGFFPFIMSVCLISFSLIHFKSSLANVGPLSLPEGKSFWPDRDGIKRIVLMNVLLFMFVIALNHLGFVLTTLSFMFFLLKFVEPQRWSTIFYVTGLSTGLSYFIFQVWLKSNLPTGFLGF